MQHAPAPQAGSTLIESVVAALVVAIGLLGVIALHLEALRATRTALVRTQAVVLAADLADRIRAHPAPAQAYDCGVGCTAGDGGDAQAIADLEDWLDAVAARLPRGVASVLFAAGVPARYDIELSWAEGGSERVGYRLEMAVGAGNGVP